MQWSLEDDSMIGNSWLPSFIKCQESPFHVKPLESTSSSWKWWIYFLTWAVRLIFIMHALMLANRNFIKSATTALKEINNSCNLHRQILLDMSEYLWVIASRTMTQNIACFWNFTSLPIYKEMVATQSQINHWTK